MNVCKQKYLQDFSGGFTHKDNEDVISQDDSSIYEDVIKHGIWHKKEGENK